MPILQQETSVYPDCLFDEDFRQASCDRKWWVIFSKSRQEKALARQLLADDLPFYLPLIPKNHLYHGRRVRSHVPLFTGYLFFYGEEQERSRMLSITKRISWMLPVKDQQQLHHDLCQIQRLIAADAPLTVEGRLNPGRRVRIKKGPMEGLEGTITARRGAIRLLIAVHLLQSGVSVEIDDYMVEPID